MNRVAWLTCALLAVADARIYGRCELARDLQALGVEPEHISTWVCIAYHESRFDTAANNPHSGDHGIFQISELYWCGPGKACGLPCSALRDDDISNDLECALQVHEEHTRLQGNGFLAWVVYPQHCKHNTKKYLVDCDTNVKSQVPITRFREFHYEDSFIQPNVTYNKQNIEDLVPPYLNIGSIFRGNYGKVLNNNKGRVDWTKYKINNIDDLKLPVFNGLSEHMILPTTSTPLSTTTTTTTMAYIPPVMPWRTIETNQFRKKQSFSDKTTPRPTNEKEEAAEQGKINQISRSTTPYAATHTTTVRPPSTTIYATRTANVPNATTYTLKSTTVTSTTFRPPAANTLVMKPSAYSSTIQQKPLHTTTAYKPTTTTYKPTTSAYKPTTTTYKPTTTTVAPWKIVTHKPRTTTTFKPNSATTTKKLLTRLSTARKETTTTLRPTLSTTSRTTTQNPSNKFSWYTFKSRIATTTTATTKLHTVSLAKTTPPVDYPSRKRNDTPFRTTHLAATTTKKPEATTQKFATTQKPKSTQSIFDLYLNPTKPPKLDYKFDSTPESKFRLKIFASGTTTLAPSKQSTSGGQKTERNGAARNYVRRQTSESEQT